VTATQYWSGTTIVVDWTVTDPAGNPVSGATVTGTVSLPDGSTAAMTVTPVLGESLYRAVYTPTMPGTHGWRLEASGAATGAVEGTVVVQRSVVGLPPITVDPATDIGRVRLLCTDLDEVHPLFSDAQIQAFLDMCGGRVKRAAAVALETIATSEALISKVIRTTDLQTDGAKVAAELRARARALREEDDEAVDEAPWAIDAVHYDPWAAYRRRGL